MTRARRPPHGSSAGCSPARVGCTTTLAVDDVVAELAKLRDSPSYWVPTMFTDDTALGQRAQEIGRPLARWAPPDPALLDAVAGVLDEGWQLADLQPGWVWAPPALRFEVGSFDELRELQRLGEVDGWRIVGSVFMRAGRVSLVVAAARHRARRGGTRRAARHPPVRPPLPRRRGGRGRRGRGRGRRRRAVSTFVDHVLASVAIVIDSGSFDPSELLDRARRIGLAGVPARAGLAGSRFHRCARSRALARRATRRRRVDPVAGRGARRGSRSCSGSPRSARGQALSQTGSIRRRASARRVTRTPLRSRPFDHESGGGEAALDATSTIPEDVLRSVVDDRAPHGEPPEPPGEDPVPREIPEIDLGEEPAVAAVTSAGCRRRSPTRSRRRPRRHAFLAGQLPSTAAAHREGGGALVSSSPMPRSGHPCPGRRSS